MKTEPENLGALNNLAMLSLVLSGLFIIIGPFGSIPGILCGLKAKRDYDKFGIQQGRGIAKSAIIVGWIGLFFFVSVSIAAVSKYSAARQRMEQMKESFDAL